jgi:UPF0042 nucleotide-binding protein
MTTADVITLISYGHLHLEAQGELPPRADRHEDVRDQLHDPAAAAGILDLDGRDPRVQDIVLRTPGAEALLDNLVAYLELPTRPRRLGIGCAGGKHRAPALVILLAKRLRARGYRVEVVHRHIHLRRVLTTAGRDAS